MIIFPGTNLNKYLKETSSATLEGGYSEWLKCYRITVFVDGQPVATGNGDDLLPAIQDCERDLIAKHEAMHAAGAQD